MSTGGDAVESLERRVLVCSPTGRDSRLIAHILGEASIPYRICATAGELLAQMPAGVGAVLIAEEALNDADQLLLAARLTAQPTWSDLALILLTLRGSQTPSVGSAIRALGNVTLLERPLRAWALLSVVRAALRARGRQYQMRDQLAELERLVTALRDAEATLRSADRRKDEFLASLAHELRNPLAPIRNCVGLLKMGKVDEALVKMARDVIDRQSEQLSRLVDDLLDLSRITRGKVSLQRAHVPMAEVLRNALETSEPALRAGGVRLHYVPPKGDIYLDVDPVRISQAVSNILNNAAKFTGEGGSVTLEAHCDEGVAEIRVRDTGVGISADMLDGIFDLFVQENRIDGRSRGGLGIGLTLVKRFVEMHGGTVSAASAGPGHGSEFTIRLPCVVENEGRNDRPFKPQHAFDAGARRVLVVDDNRDNASTLRDLLDTLGFNVRVAHDGLEALALVDEAMPEVVIMDIGMPEMDGFETARRIRAREDSEGCVLIAMTGWSQEEYRARARSAGFDHHLVKPVDIDQLRSLLTVARRPETGRLESRAN